MGQQSHVSTVNLEYNIWTITIKQHLIYQKNVTNQILKYMMYCPIETSLTLILVLLKILLLVYVKYVILNERV